MLEDKVFIEYREADEWCGLFCGHAYEGLKVRFVFGSEGGVLTTRENSSWPFVENRIFVDGVLVSEIGLEVANVPEGSYFFQIDLRRHDYEVEPQICRLVVKHYDTRPSLEQMLFSIESWGTMVEKLTMTLFYSEEVQMLTVRNDLGEDLPYFWALGNDGRWKREQKFPQKSETSLLFVHWDRHGGEVVLPEDFPRSDETKDYNVCGVILCPENQGGGTEQLAIIVPSEGLGGGRR